MRDLVAERNDGQPVPQSALKARFLQVIREAGLPTPVRQLDVGDREGWVGRVDFAYPRARLLIELDGRRHHTALLDWERDLGRGNRLVAGGWRLVRITWRELADHPDRVVELLRRALTDLPGSGNE